MLSVCAPADRLGRDSAVLPRTYPHIADARTRAGYAAAVAEANGPEAGLPFGVD